MGKSASCFKIMACGSDSQDKDDNDIPEVSHCLLLRSFPFHLLSQLLHFSARKYLL